MLTQTYVFAAMGAAPTTPRQIRDSQVEHLKKSVKGNLLTPNSYAKLRKEFVAKKRAPAKDKNGKVYEGSELSDAEVQDHGFRLLIYASTMKHACRRAQLEKEVWDNMQETKFDKVRHGHGAIGSALQETGKSVHQTYALLASACGAHKEATAKQDEAGRLLQHAVEMMQESTEKLDGTGNAFNAPASNITDLIGGHNCASVYNKAGLKSGRRTAS